MEARWLLLIHQIPPKPDYFRVKVRRRLNRIGAHLLKNSVYVLPNSEESLEDFLWLAQEIRAGGGEAAVVEAAFVAGYTDDEVSAMVDSARASVGHEPPEAAAERIEPGRTWVTRVGVKVDRMASAWLIRRFIDPQARFRFVRGREQAPLPGELRFDMFEAEFTHEGDRCTFETLCTRLSLEDPALRAVGEIVHDIDLKEEKFARPETAGVARLLAGLARRTRDDGERIQRGGQLFDDLYESFPKRGGGQK